MASPPETIARLLLSKALSISVSGADGRTIAPKGGRTGEGGQISETPYVEIGDVGWAIEGYRPRTIRASYAVIFYRQFAKEADREKEDLRELFWALYRAIDQDPTLGGAVLGARVVSGRSGLTQRAGRDYWYWIAAVEVVFKDEGMITESTLETIAADCGGTF